MLDITRGEFRCTTCSDHWSPDFSFDFGNSLHPQQPPPAASRVGLKFFTSAIIAYRTTQDSPGESSDFCSKISWRNYKQAYFTCFVHLHGNISGREHIYIYMSTYVFNFAYTYVVYINLCADIFLWKSKNTLTHLHVRLQIDLYVQIHVHKQNIYV